MAFYKQEGVKGSTESECPVCYEGLSGSERTLSCGHVFCHDCLVRTLGSITPDGPVRDSIICPVCRHLTFILRQRDAAGSLLPADKEEARVAQTLQVPIRAPTHCFTHHPDALLPPAARAAAPGWYWGDCPRWMGALRRHMLVFPHLDHNASQIFIISEQGRPMAEEDALREVSTATVQPPQVRRRRVTVCTTWCWLIFLMSVFTILALIAATLPWVLLA